MANQSNDDRSNSLNQNNAANKASQDNRSNQLNPNQQVEQGNSKDTGGQQKKG